MIFTDLLCVIDSAVDTRIGYADGNKLFGWNKLSFSSGWPVAI
jgi:hypothetical protein